MSHWQPNDGLDDEDAAEEEYVTSFGGRDATIYLIDAHSITSDEVQFRLCLECIEQDMLKSISENAKDLAAVVFYNTENSPVPKDVAEDEELTTAPPHCAVFMSMKPLSKQSISYFKNFRKSIDFFDFPNTYGTNPNGKFADALWLCSRLVMRCSYKLSTSTIILFTNNEQPHMPGSLELQQTMNRAKDLMENDIGVYLVPMVDEFDCNLFYKEFLARVSDEELDAIREIVPEVQRQTLLDRITRKNFHKKCLRHINLVLGDGLEISCDLHSFIKLAKKPTAIKMLRDTNEVLVAKRCYVVPQTNAEPHTSADTQAEARPQMDAEPRADAEPPSMGAESDANSEVPRTETTQKLLPGELFKYQEIGGQEVAFSAEELTSLKTLVPPGLRLLGFKPIETLAPRCFVKCCVFLSPSDGLIKGSTKLFRALWEKCLEKGVYALCTLTYRRKVAPRYVALVPQSDEIDGKDGFRVVYVPMETDYNHLDVLDVEPPEVSESSVDIFAKLCKKLRFDYRPEMFSNPSLQKFYEEMEALVFDDNVDPFVDETMPEVETQEEKIKDYVAEIKEIFGSDQAGASKRSNTSAANGNQSKSAKTELSMSDIEQAVIGGRAANCTVQNLKDFIKSKGKTFPASSVKKNLVTLAENIVNMN